MSTIKNAPRNELEEEIEKFADEGTVETDNHTGLVYMADSFLELYEEILPSIGEMVYNSSFKKDGDYLVASELGKSIVSIKKKLGDDKTRKDVNAAMDLLVETGYLSKEPDKDRPSYNISELADPIDRYENNVYEASEIYEALGEIMVQANELDEDEIREFF